MGPGREAGLVPVKPAVPAALRTGPFTGADASTSHAVFRCGPVGAVETGRISRQYRVWAKDQETGYMAGGVDALNRVITSS